MDGSVNSVAVFLFALAPVLMIGALVTDLLLASAPRRGKRPDVAAPVTVPPGRGGNSGGARLTRRLTRWWPAIFQGALGGGAILHSLAGRPTWPMMGFYVLAALSALAFSRALARRSAAATSAHAGQMKK